MPEVDILLASYNGEKYIAEQIDSILAQTFTDWRLLIRDDGSSDNTPAIIEGYAEKYPGKIEVIHDNETCRNATKNFFELLKHAEADYVMFSDQDDFWLPYKIQITYDYMKKAERENPGRPVLIFTGLQVVDSELKSMDRLRDLDFSEKRYTLKELLPCNCSAGCTQMLNRKCYECMGGFEEGILLHDYWTMLYAAVFGVIMRVPMALILYRQHGNNLIGVFNKNAKLSARIKRYAKNLFGAASLTNPLMSTSVKLFRSRFSEAMSPETLNEFDEYLKFFSKKISERLKAVMRFKDTIFFKGHKSSIIRLLFLGNK